MVVRGAAVGKSTKPMRIVVPPSWLDHPVVKRWVETGHTIEPINDETIDLMVGPKAWHMPLALLERYGEIALKWAREARYGVANPQALKRKAPKSKATGPGRGKRKAQGGDTTAGGSGEGAPDPPPDGPRDAGGAGEQGG